MFFHALLAQLALLLILLTCVAVRFGFQSRRGWLDKATKRRVIVQTTEEQTLDGVLVATYPDGLLLVDTRIIGTQGVVVGGQVFVPRSKVEWVQVPAAPREA